ncbi:MAG: hypothetical protein NPIRA03_01730 [Nitrospirales bacterium]|nr:MAG: hypothetical protein NPIRA03_01730 [Nitrospirales bacterium]
MANFESFPPLPTQTINQEESEIFIPAKSFMFAQPPNNDPSLKKGLKGGTHFYASSH